MVYAGRAGKRKVTLGVSGRLMKRNLVMWDPETNSLWSQITGKAIYGSLEGSSLSMLPAVFVSLGTWKKMHPGTVVLDMSPVRRKAWHYTVKELAKARNEHRQALGIGVRYKDKTLLVDLEHLHKARVAQATVSGLPLVFVWVKKERAALVYKDGNAGSGRKIAWRGGKIAVPGGRGHWDSLTGRPVSRNSGRPLERFAYIPTTVEAWRTYYPEGEMIGGR
jgi:hypothetical protein